jgi:hypothetical protein
MAWLASGNDEAGSVFQVTPGDPFAEGMEPGWYVQRAGRGLRRDSDGPYASRREASAALRRRDWPELCQRAGAAAFAALMVAACIIQLLAAWQTIAGAIAAAVRLLRATPPR